MSTSSRFLPNMIVLASITGIAQAQAPFPEKIAYQTRIFTPSGVPFETTSGTTTIKLRIYAQPNPGPGVTPLHTSTLSEKVIDGYAPLTFPDSPTNPLGDIFKQNQDLYLEMEVDGQKLSPLTRLTAVPYSFRSEFSDEAGVAADVPQKAITPASITINGLQVLDAAGNVNGASLGVNGTTLFDASGQWVAPGPLNGWQLINGGQVVSSAVSVQCQLTCQAQHLEIRQPGGAQQPAIHFHRTGTGFGGAFDARLALVTADVLEMRGADLVIANDANDPGDPTLWLSKTFGSPTGAKLFYQETENPGHPSVKVPHLRLAENTIFSAGFLQLRNLDSSQPGIDFTQGFGAGQVTSGAPSGDDDYDIRLQLITEDLLELKSASFHVNGSISATQSCCSSDERLKKSISPISDAMAILDRLSGVTYEWRDAARETSSYPDSSPRRYGVIAQQVSKVMPEAVVTMPDGFLGVEYDQLIPVLVEAVREHVARTDAELAAKTTENATQAKRIDDLEARLAALAERLETLERR